MISGFHGGEMRRSQDLIVWGDNCRPDEKHIGVELHGHMVFRAHTRSQGARTST